MTGPEHYRMAEALLRGGQMEPDVVDTDDEGRPVETYDPHEDNVTGLMAAQVHATLALAAATAATRLTLLHADGMTTSFIEGADAPGHWDEVTS